MSRTVTAVPRAVLSAISTAVIALDLAAVGLLDRLPSPSRERSRGQSTAEYALVLLGAATVAVVFVAWAGKTSRIAGLFNAVLDAVIGKV